MSLVISQVQKSLLPYQQNNVLQKSEYLNNPLYELSDHTGSINEVKFSPDGNFLATCSEEIILWSINSDINSLGALKPHKFGITSISWSPDSKTLISSSADTTLCLQDINTGTILRRIKSHKQIVNTVTFLNDFPNLILSGDDDGIIYVHDIREKKPITHIKSNSPVISISAINNTFIVGGVCGNLFIDILDLNTKKIHLLNKINGDSIIFGTSLSPNLKYSCINDSNGYFRIYNIQLSTEENKRLQSELHYCEANKEIIPIRNQWSNDGKYIIIGGFDQLLRIYNVENTYNPILTYELPGHKGTVTGVSFHPNKPIIASGSSDGIVILGELSLI